MYKSKLIQVFQQIETNEMSELRRFLLSPLYNVREDVVQLFVVLRKIKTFDKKQVDRRKIFEQVYHKPYDDKECRRVMSFLHKALSQFLIYREMQKDQEQQQLYLTKAYRSRNLSKAFKQTVQTVEAAQEEQPLRHGKYHYWQYQLHLEQYNKVKNQRRATDMNLQPLTDSFDVYYMANKLKQSCLLLAHQPFYNKTYDFGLLDNMLAYVEQEKYLQIPAIGVYYYAYQALTKGEDTYFIALKEHIAKYGAFFPINEIREIYLLAINFGIKRLNIGNQLYIREVFELYREALGRNVLFEHGLLSQWTYKNIVALGLRLKEFDWVEDFIKNYTKYLEEKHQEGSYAYNLARLRYNRKEYEAAILLLANVRYDDLLPNLTAKVLLIKIYYESDEIEALNSLLHSFEVLLHRQKEMGYHKENYLNFVRFTKKLLLVNPYDKDTKKELIETIKEVNILTEKQWLLGILEEL